MIMSPSDLNPAFKLSYTIIQKSLPLLSHQSLSMYFLMSLHITDDFGLGCILYWSQFHT